KVIYDKLKAYTDHYQIVWVSNQQFPFNDPNVITVKRLSPEYYHYLSRAKYWINNQNFPHYISKPKDTIYIQTWHGTPLKKMLNIKNVLTEQFNIGIISFHQVHMHLNVLDQPLNFIKIY